MNSRASDAAKRATTPMRFSASPDDDPASFGTTRREFNQPKLSPREKAKRNMLTHTLQMPLVVSPVQPPAANPATAVDRAVQLAATQRQGSLPSPLPGGWTSVQRIGAAAPPDAEQARHPSARSTEPMAMGRGLSDWRRIEREEAHAETIRMQPAMPARAVPQPEPYLRHQGSLPSSPASLQDSWTQLRTGDYERVTLPGDSVRIPELSGREWMFIALLACASAATLYSLIVDDVTTASQEEDSASAATTAPHEHLVQPALPNSAPAEAARASAPAAAVSDTTELVSEPSSAEIVLGGAVIGNTPAKVTRGPGPIEYLLRKQGYEPQLVRITPNSPTSITITLHPK